EALRTTEAQIQAVAGNLVKARSRVERARQDLQRAERAAADKRQTLAKCEQRRVSAQTTLVSAQDTLAALHRAHAAHELQETLAAGKAIRELLPADLRDDADWRARLRARVERAAQRLKDAERSVTSAQGIVTATSNDVAGIEAEIRTIPRQLEERCQVLRVLHGRCREAETALRKVLGDRPGPDAGARLAAIDVELHAAETETERAEAAVQKAQQVLDGTRILRTEVDQHLAA